MTAPFADEIRANLERAEQSLRAARHLTSTGFFFFFASRAYYGAFYAANALLLNERTEMSKHSAVIASIHRHFVRTGKLSQDHGKSLNWLFELRDIGDYGATEHVSEDEALRAIKAAEEFISAVKSLLNSD